MNKRWFILLPVLLLLGAVTWALLEGQPLGLIAATAALAGIGLFITDKSTAVENSGLRTVVLAADPTQLAKRRQYIDEELAVLEDAQDLQRGVFEVSAELVGCVDESDARSRFAAAIRRYWNYSEVDLVVWERGSWRGLGGPIHGDVPALGAPVMLPGKSSPDLVLDLSPGVDGQAALVLRHAQLQPSLKGRSTGDQRYVAEVLRTQLSLSLRRVVLYGELQSLARIDPLTGTSRRWYGETRLSELCESGEVVSVAMVDIDLFKSVNDLYGHTVGDEVLAAVGKALLAQLRIGDLVSRQGGEEFLVILPETPPAGALQVAERLREAVATINDMPCPITVSIGVAACHQDENAASLISRADAALYLAKGGGRNRVVISDDGGAESYLRITSRRSRSTTGETSVYRAMDRERKTPPPEE
jgi:diguanylate cyclase (GGDEF)-like protein